MLKSRLRRVAGCTGDSFHQKGPFNVVITCCGSLLGICSVGTGWQKTVPSAFEKRPTLIIKTYPIFLALFPSPHIPSFVLGLIFLSQHYLCYIFIVYSRSDVSMKHGKPRKCLRHSWLFFGAVSGVSFTLLVELWILSSLKYCPVNQWLADRKGYLLWPGSSPVKRSDSPEQEVKCKQDGLVFTLTCMPGFWNLMWLISRDF